MWSKTACRFSSAVRLSGLNSVKRVRCSCIQQADAANGYQHTRRKHTKSSGQSNGGATSPNNGHIAAVAGAGLALSAYLLWHVKRSAFASGVETEEQAGVADVEIDPNDPNQTQATTDSNTVFAPTEGTPEVVPVTESEPIDWSKVPDIPAHVPYLLIGGGIASLEAYKAIKTKDINAKVLMISEEDFPPYMRPTLSKHFWFDDDLESYKSYEYTNLRGKKSSVFLSAGLYMEPKKLPYFKHGGLGFLQKTKVVKLDAINKKVTLDNGAEISFDKCLIATGGRPRNVQVLQRAGADVQERTTLFRNLNNLYDLMEATGTAKSVAVIGGGFLGTELAVGLAYRGEKTGMKVYQIFPERGNMAKVLPLYLSQWTTEKVREDGVEVFTGANLMTAIFDDGKILLRLTSGQLIKVDHVVVAVGIEPNTELAESGGLELDDVYGGYRVNTELQARTDIWAAGDCACFYDSKLGRRRVEHFDHAEITGRLAGFNMTGDAQPYTYQSMFWSTVGANEYEAVGLVDSKLETFSVFRRRNAAEQKENSEVKDDTNATKSIKEKAKEDETKPEIKSETLADKYDHGVVFYLKNEEIVGVVLWNLTGFRGNPSRLDIARQIIADGAKGQDLTEVAKLFNIYKD